MRLSQHAGVARCLPATLRVCDALATLPIDCEGCSLAFSYLLVSQCSNSQARRTGPLRRDHAKDCCNLNLYMDGGSTVGWHADDEALFQGSDRTLPWEVVGLILFTGMTACLCSAFAWSSAVRSNWRNDVGV